MTDGPNPLLSSWLFAFSQLCYPSCSCLFWTGEPSGVRWSHQCWVEIKHHFPWLSGDTLTNAAQEALGILFHWSIWLVHEKFDWPEHFLTRCFPDCQYQACAGACAYSSNRRMACHSTLYWTSRSSCWPITSTSQVPLDCSKSIWFINHFSQVCITCKAAESALWSTIQVNQEDTKYHWHQYPHLGYYTAYWPPDGPGGADHNSVCSTI